VSSDIATTLQTALVAAGIATGGVIMTPHVMEQIRNTDGSLVESYQPTPWLHATNSLTAAAVTKLMQAVVTRGTAAPSPSFSGFPPSGTWRRRRARRKRRAPSVNRSPMIG
jgi:cell division protein FtsI/penicillin-binding protein 2